VSDLSGILPELRAAAAAWQVVDLTDIDQARKSDAASVATASATDISGLVGGPVAVEEATFATGPARSTTRTRIYRSPQGAGTPGALLFLHGGAFCLGDLDTDHLRCLAYARRAGITVVSVDYPLAPEHPYPSGLNTGIAAAEWMRASAADLGIDPHRIGIGGESAGATLAAGVTLALRDRNRFPPRCQVLLFPALDYRQSTESMRTNVDSPAWNAIQTQNMWRHYLGTDPASFHSAPGSARPNYASPGIEHDLVGLPPALVVTAEIDPLRDEGIDYATRLMRAGVAVELHNYSGTFHVFDFAAPRAAVSARALDEQVQFLRRHLGSGAQN
jgi:acetyl esterase/lipase